MYGKIQYFVRLVWHCILATACAAGALAAVYLAVILLMYIAEVFDTHPGVVLIVALVGVGFGIIWGSAFHKIRATQ